jgi:DNA-binding transcriptional LysR family regulator
MAMNKIERMAVDSDLLHTFVVIAECRNLTIAAGRLHRTQSAISVQLRRLEDALGVSLFNRTSRGMRLTPAGETLLPRARSVCDEVAGVGRLFQEPLRGSIRVGIPDDFDANVLEKVLADFARSHPGVNVIASSGCTSAYPAAVKEGVMDIAVCSGPENPDGDLLGTERTVWAASAGMHLAPDQPVPLAILDRSCWWRNLPSDALSAAGRAYTVAFLSSSFASLQAAIRAGFAIGAVPENCLCPETVALSKRDGFPPLPSSCRFILTSQNAPPDLTKAMRRAIRSALV